MAGKAYIPKKRGQLALEDAAEGIFGMRELKWASGSKSELGEVFQEGFLELRRQGKAYIPKKRSQLALEDAAEGIFGI